MTSSSPPTQHSNLKARREVKGAIVLVARCGTTAEFQCDDAESIRHSVYSAGFSFVRDLSIVRQVKGLDDSLA